MKEKKETLSQNAPFEFARLLSRVLSFRALVASAKTIKDAIRALRRENAALRKLRGFLRRLLCVNWEYPAGQ